MCVPPGSGGGPLVRRVLGRCLRALAALREFHAAQVELRERWWLSQQPWLEDVLHWSFDGDCWRLHGSWVPRDGRPRSVTRGGWCQGLRSAPPE